MDIAILESYISRFYGYGSWNAPLWFIGMEEGGCPTLDEFSSRLICWSRRGSAELEDAPAYHKELNFTRWFGPKAKLQSTWEKLVRIYLSSQGLLSDIEAVRHFQGERFGSRDCGFASLELFPLPSTDTSAWIYRDAAHIPYLINRQVYKYYVYPKRAEGLRQRIATHRPKYVIIYGLAYVDEWEGIIGKKFGGRDSHNVHETTFESSRILVVPHPVARGLAQPYWQEIGKRLNEGHHELPEPMPNMLTPPPATPQTPSP
jgi:hypothetical protein